MTRSRIIIDGASLTCDAVVAVARDEAPVTIAAGAVTAARAAWETAREVATRRPVYGRTTGVGANRNVGLAGDELAGHGLRLLRSHAAGSGPLQPPDLGRAMLVTRLNQIGAGGSGVNPAVLDVLADALNRGFTPPVPLYGAIGTGDLTALASTGLCLIGERAWRTGTGPPPRFPLRPAEAPGFMSSNAATLGEAALACHDLRGLVSSAVVIAALSLLAVRGSLEPYAPAVHQDRPAGQQRVARRMRALLAGPGLASTGLASTGLAGTGLAGACARTRAHPGLLRLPGLSPGARPRGRHAGVRRTGGDRRAQRGQ